MVCTQSKDPAAARVLFYEQDKINTETKVPFFGDLPLLGWMFKSKEAKDNKTELLIFLTPRILSDNLSMR